MADNKLVGQNYTTPDLVAKVTGNAKYAEDYRVEGMLFAKMLVSPMPHARVTRLDTSEALAMPGVKAILTADDMPGAAAGATLGEGVQATAQAERGLTNEPLYQGEPILAVAAIDEATAAEAIEAIEIEFEPLPFVVDPIESLRPGGANARTQGNVWMRPPRRRPPRRTRPANSAAAPTPPRRGRRRRPRRSRARRRRRGAPAAAAPAQAAGAAPRTGSAEARSGRRAADAVDAAPPPHRRPRSSRCWKWTDEDFKNAGEGQMPLGKATDEWTFGNVEEGLKKADLVLDETFMTQSTGHQPLETRTAMAYWQNGKLYLHGSTQSTVQTVAAVARWTGVAAGAGRASSASTPAAASAARFRARSSWRFRRCSRRKPTRR